MNTQKLKKGNKFYHPDLNHLLMCRDRYFNHVYDKKDSLKHVENKIKYFTVDNSGQFHTTNYKSSNNWKEFIVVRARYYGGGFGYGPNDVYPDAWEVVCKPVGVEGVLIKFNQETNCYAHTINEVFEIKK
jgi:hypothetical protein